MSDPVVILGLGFTTQRLARRLRKRGVPVYAAVRGPERFREFAALGVRLCGLSPDDLPKGAVLIHSVPPLPDPERSGIRTLIRGIDPRRILYISSTGVYGARTHVTEHSPAAPNDEKGHARLEEEEWLASLADTLILRSPAIYGPGRGIHVRLREGKRPRGAGGIVSRIHVDDLAAMLEAGVESKIHGAWPVGDDHPAASEEVAAWCAKSMGTALPDAAGRGFPVAGRAVDGRRIRELLGVRLKYASFQDGIPASLKEEAPAGQ
jgi:nucleoside-diphosphate-sugar epimerase